MSCTSRFLAAFGVPEAAEAVIDRMVSADEMALIAAVAEQGLRVFTAGDAARIFSGREPAGGVPVFLEAAWRRGVLLREGEDPTRYRAGSFYSRLDTFAVTQTQEFLALSTQTRCNLDDWYFEAYVAQLGDAPSPTADRTVTLAQACEEVDRQEGGIWLNPCDCRLLAGNCGKPTDTCITFANGPNSLVRRGFSKPLSKEEAKAVLRRAARAGLMQTVSSHGICNCCGDCCYLFRAQRARGSHPVWPAQEWLAAFDAEACISCGVCERRCPFHAFARAGGGMQFEPAQCRGCGLCAQTCPVKAIHIYSK